MSPDPHAPTPAGPDPDAVASVVADTGSEPADAVGETEPATAPVDAVAGPEPVTAPDPFVPESSVTPADPDGASTVVVPPEPAFTPPVPVVPPPDPVVSTPSAFTPPGTPQADGPAAQAAALAEKPEVQVGLAFLGGAVLTFVLRRFGR